VKFNVAKASQGTAFLRIALAGADSTTLAIGVNGQTVGSIRPVATNALALQHQQGRVEPVHPEVRRLSDEAGARMR